MAGVRPSQCSALTGLTGFGPASTRSAITLIGRGSPWKFAALVAQEETKAADRFYDLHAPCQQLIAGGGPTDEDLPGLRPAEALNVDLAGTVELKHGQAVQDVIFDGAVLPNEASETDQQTTRTQSRTRGPVSDYLGFGDRGHRVLLKIGG